MKVLMKVTSVSALTNERILVQLQGKYGNAQLHLPTSQEAALRLGDECTLDSAGGIIKNIGELDEVEERLTASNDAKTKGLLEGLGRKISLED